MTKDRQKGKDRKFSQGSLSAKETMVELRAEGRSYDEIAGILDVSRQTLFTWSKELRLEIENAKTFKLDSIKAKYQILQVHRVEQYSQMLKAVIDELAKRNLEEVPTEKLFEMYLKLSKTIPGDNIKLQTTEIRLPTELSDDMWHHQQDLS